MPGGTHHSARHQHAALRISAQHQAGGGEAHRSLVARRISGWAPPMSAKPVPASRVRRMYVPDKGRAQLIEGDAAAQAARLAEIIREFKGDAA